MSGIKMVRLVKGLVIVPVLAGGVLFASPMQGTAEDFGPVLAIEVKADVAELGKRLFFDPRLSGDATISCASCHMPENARGPPRGRGPVSALGKDAHRHSRGALRQR